MINDLPIQAVIKEVEVPVQEIIVNNERKTVNAKVYSICCSKCGRVIFSFHQGDKYEDIYQSLVDAREDLNKHFSYCPECGRELRFDFDIIDAEDFVVESVNE